jgi:hypothetical protein
MLGRSHSYLALLSTLALSGNGVGNGQELQDNLHSLELFRSDMDRPFCYIQLTNGNIQDLTELCENPLDEVLSTEDTLDSTEEAIIERDIANQRVRQYCTNVSFLGIERFQEGFLELCGQMGIGLY